MNLKELRNYSNGNKAYVYKAHLLRERSTYLKLTVSVTKYQYIASYHGAAS